MELIAELADYIEDEIADAKKYARHAIRLQDRKPDLAKLFYNLSTEELGHMDRLHSAVKGLIAQYRDEHGEPPADMQARYDRMHLKSMDRAAEVYGILGRFKG